MKRDLDWKVKTMKVKRPTQKDRIIDYIKRFGSITPMDAFNDLGITKLATRISELKDEGFIFHTTIEKGKNRFGTPTHYARYRLVGDE